MTRAARMAALRSVGPFPSLQIVPSRSDDDTLDLLSNPASGVTPGGPVQPLTYHGGPTITDLKVVALYAGQPWFDRATNDKFLTELLSYGYLSMLQGGFKSGRYLGGFDAPAAAAHVTDSDCQAMIAAALASNSAIPRPDANTLYMLILPNGTSIGDGTPANSNCTGFCGYHSSTAQFIYAIHPATICNTCNQGDAYKGETMVQGHEIAEAANDPHGTGWYNDQNGMENGDECAWVPIQWGPWTVQGYAAQDGSGNWIDAVGPYTVPVQPQPQPQPKPVFTPIPLTIAWLGWQTAASGYVADHYQKGDVAGAVAEEAVLARYQPGIAAMLAGQPHNLPDALPAHGGEDA